MGGSQQGVEYNYEWWDGESINGGYTHWSNGEPNRPNEHCMALASSTEFANKLYQWLDVMCEVTDRIVYTLCQKNITGEYVIPPLVVGYLTYVLTVSDTG